MLPRKLILSGVLCKNNHFLGWKAFLKIIMKKQKFILAAVIGIALLEILSNVYAYGEPIVQGINCCGNTGECVTVTTDGGGSYTFKGKQC
jgi:hypothetical protein